MKLDFFKMHAQGNDYIYFDFCSKKLPELDLPEIAIKLSDRNFGIGSDGIVLILDSDQCDAEMRMFNADGSEGLMCGSALRCVSYYLSQKTGKQELRILTRSGIKTGLVKSNGQITIDIGKPDYIDYEVFKFDDQAGNIITVGNSHFVTFVNDLPVDNVDLKQRVNSIISHFPDGVNIEYVKILSTNEIEVIFWERGSGATLACGTGACAAVFCGIEKELLSSPVKVRMPGGDVSVEMIEDNIYLTGKVDHVFDGSIEI